MFFFCFHEKNAVVDPTEQDCSTQITRGARMISVPSIAEGVIADGGNQSDTCYDADDSFQTSDTSTDVGGKSDTDSDSDLIEIDQVLLDAKLVNLYNGKR